MDKSISHEFLGQIKTLLDYISKNYHSFIEKQLGKVDELFELLENRNSVHLYGKGRSGSIAVSLALRLSHFGYKTYFLGDVIKEPFTKGDLIILFSGSGDTSEVVEIARKGKSMGSSVVAFTSFKDSSLAKNSDVIFLLPGGLEKEKGWSYVEAQLSHRASSFYGGGEFEFNAYLFQEALINSIGKFKNISGSEVAKRHERDETLKV